MNHQLSGRARDVDDGAASAERFPSVVLLNAQRLHCCCFVSGVDKKLGRISKTVGLQSYIFDEKTKKYQHKNVVHKPQIQPYHTLVHCTLSHQAIICLLNKMFYAVVAPR